MASFSVDGRLNSERGTLGGLLLCRSVGPVLKGAP